MKSILNVLIFFIASVGCFSAFASDKQRERDYAHEIRHQLKIGEALWLEAQGQRFLTLYTETTDSNNLGTAIILHDQGNHPDSKPLLHSLRVRLPEHRWATLSIQLPVLESGASTNAYYSLFEEAKARIDSARKYLIEGNVNNIVIIGYSMGALMGLYAMHENVENIKAVVNISLPHPHSLPQDIAPLQTIQTLQLPVLDIYAENDLAEVTQFVRQRKLAARKNAFFKQHKINNTNHSYLHLEELVTKRVFTWLRSVVAPSP